MDTAWALCHWVNRCPGGSLSPENRTSLGDGDSQPKPGGLRGLKAEDLSSVPNRRFGNTVGDRPHTSSDTGIRVGPAALTFAKEISQQAREVLQVSPFPGGDRVWDQSQCPFLTRWLA